ncbi:MAG: hypothetical protein K9G58_06730 [Bacteroidales bacterium]|nr:hypothetical protein [Bacteroidales bacterium]MCF8387366.1 hypothetical protein [Bacteroidales bacterium]MCF8397844.1 hypothetical protein [Bacteroidales bacterium]
MKRLLFAFAFIFAILSCVKAQDYYKTGVGLRLGSGFGLTVKHFTTANTALEGIVVFRWRGINITGLWEYERRAFRTPGLSWYIGGGGHIGIWSNYDENAYWWDYEEHPNGYTIIGADFILGLEYTVKEFPINFSVDWKPALNLIGYPGVWLNVGALSIRYGFRY